MKSILNFIKNNNTLLSVFLFNILSYTFYINQYNLDCVESSLITNEVNNIPLAEGQFYFIIIILFINILYVFFLLNIKLRKINYILAYFYIVVINIVQSYLCFTLYITDHHYLPKFFLLSYQRIDVAIFLFLFLWALLNFVIIKNIKHVLCNEFK